MARLWGQAAENWEINILDEKSQFSFFYRKMMMIVLLCIQRAVLLLNLFHKGRVLSICANPFKH